MGCCWSGSGSGSDNGTGNSSSSDLNYLPYPNLLYRNITRSRTLPPEPALRDDTYDSMG